MKRFVFILVAVMVVAGIAFARDAPQDPPKEPPKSNEQKEPAPDPALVARIDELIKQLGDDDIRKRDAAQAELVKIGKPALAPVEKVLKDTDDPEVRNRATAIAEEIGKTIFTLIGKNEQGCEEYRHWNTGMVFVKIPGGTFNMGSEYENDNEEPVHELKLDGFLILKYEVTQAVWQKVMGDNPSEFKGDNNPVENVSWDDCREFCRKAGLRLPTEAEWEYACRAGTTTRYYWGDEPDGDYMWYGENPEDTAQDTTHPVGQKKPNGFGLYDMAGNVWEWCADWYGKKYYANSPQDNPTGPDSGEGRITRGGGWGASADNCRSAIRFYGEPTYLGNNIGLRCAADLAK